MTQVNFWDISPVAHPAVKNLEIYDYKTAGAPRRYWRRNDFPVVADYLMNQRENLIKDFLKECSSLDEAIKINNPQSVSDQLSQLGGLPVPVHSIGDLDVSEFLRNSGLTSWKAIGLRFENKRLGILSETDEDDEKRIKYPTAYKLIQRFQGDIGNAGYSIIEPNSVIDRHTGPENRDGEYLRIHIPLIIPIGDIFFECLGEIITWDDIWGFNNQLIHSAHNYTNEYRLIFLIDLRRTAIGLEPGEPFDEKWQIHAKPFIRE